MSIAFAAVCELRNPAPCKVLIPAVGAARQREGRQGWHREKLGSFLRTISFRAGIFALELGCTNSRWRFLSTHECSLGSCFSLEGRRRTTVHFWHLKRRYNNRERLCGDFSNSNRDSGETVPSQKVVHPTEECEGASDRKLTKDSVFISPNQDIITRKVVLWRRNCSGRLPEVIRGKAGGFG